MVIKRNHRKKGKGRLLQFLVLIAVIIGISGYLLLKLNKLVFAPNVDLRNRSTADFYIPTGSTFDEVNQLFQVSGFLMRPGDFEWLAKKKNYPVAVKAGRYVLQEGMSNNELVNLLRSGAQTPVKLTFNNIRTKKELAGRVSDVIEADSMNVLNALNDSILLDSLGFSSHTIYAMMLPNTYEMWWNTSPTGFLRRMHREYENFWTSARLKKARDAGLTPIEVATLASIVDEETIKADEKPVVAGLYINRINRGMRLQADPTIKFVLGDFSIKRVLNKDLKIDSPYNTYLYTGLPPGPIRVPSIQGIEAVLNHQKHAYLYMVAKKDFSGYHNFSKTLQQHNRNAARYRQALRERRIWR